MRALVTGATGFVGRRLLRKLHHPIVLSRQPDEARAELGFVDCYPWNASGGSPPPQAFEGIDTIFHLAGEPVASGRWTRSKKRRIRNSRVDGTRHLVEGLAAIEVRPKVLVSASAIGFYGSRGDEVLDETTSAGDDFLAEICKDWEAESRRAEKLGIRVVNIRIGIVLGPDGGALAQMLPPFRFGLGGRLGSGRQWMSWVHLDDLIDLLLYAAQNDSLHGAVNGVAPEPVTNREFTGTLAQLLRRPAVLPAPPLGLKLMIGGFANVLLASQRVLPTAAQEAGFGFRYLRLEGALREILPRYRRR